MPRYAAAADREKRRGVTVCSAAPQPKGISEGRMGTGSYGGEGCFAAQSCDPERFPRGSSFGGTGTQQRNDGRLPGGTFHADQPGLFQRSQPPVPGVALDAHLAQDRATQLDRL